MHRLAIALTLAAVGCAGGSSLQTITLVNKTPRTIQELYVYKAGADRGASRGKLAPQATTTVQMPNGGVAIYAIGDKIIIDQHTRETPEASGTVELNAPISIVFDDSNAPDPDLKKSGAREITFQIATPKAAADPGAGADAPGAPAPTGDAP
jgi:hypothetical protein